MRDFHFYPILLDLFDQPQIHSKHQMDTGQRKQEHQHHPSNLKLNLIESLFQSQLIGVSIFSEISELDNSFSCSNRKPQVPQV